MTKILKGLPRLFALIILNIGVPLLTLELFLGFIIKNPRYAADLPNSILQMVRIPAYKARRSIQENPECSRFDRELFYTLRPGTCRFWGREFDTTIAVNSMGTRDDEASLDKPRIVFLGDSVTMGWGVEAEDSFPSLIEKNSGKKALNMGISSYGTVRQLLLLKRVDLSEVESVVIQYHHNDYLENRTFLQSGVHRASYPQNFKNLTRDRYAYYPFRFLSSLIHELGRSKTIPPEKEVETFLQVLDRLYPPPRPFNLVVFDGSECDLLKRGFTDRLRLKLEAKGASSEMIVTELSSLQQEDYFPLDAHPLPRGHRKIAEAILEALSRGKPNQLGSPQS